MDLDGVIHHFDHADVDVFFMDDSPTKLPGAVEIGMTARHYEGVETFRRHLAELVSGRQLS